MKNSKPIQKPMSQFSSEDFDGHFYDQIRPSYTESFYSYLLSYHEECSSNCNQCGTILDVGSGPGTAVFQMKKLYEGKFDKIIATDASATMLEAAKSRVELDKNKANPKIEVQVATCMDLSENLSKEVEMITAAEAAHYFIPFKSFLEEAKKVLKPNGTLAIWGYDNPIFVEYPELDYLLNSLDCDKKYLGEFWDQPGRSIMRGLLEKQEITVNDGFYDIRVEKFTHDDYRRGNKSDYSLVMSNMMTIEQFKNLVWTWSGASSREAKLHDVDKMLDSFFEHMFSLVPHLTWNSTVTVHWETVYKFARKGSSV